MLTAQTKRVGQSRRRKVVHLVVQDDARLGVHHARAKDQVDRRRERDGSAPLIDDRKVSRAVVFEDVELRVVVRELVGAVLQVQQTGGVRSPDPDRVAG
jgi:hypothetical protein